MRHFVRLQLIAAAALLMLGAFAQPASADQITETVSGCSGCNGYTFQATLNSLGSNNYSLSYTIANVSGAPATAQSWSLTLFPSGQGISSFSDFSVSDGNTGAYSVLVGKSNNGANGNCNSNLSDALCVTLSGVGSPSLIGLGQSLNFSFNFNCTNCTALSSWDFLSHGYCTPGNGNCYAISANGTPTSRVGVPEPSVLALLASEMALMAGVVLVFGPVRNRFLQRWVTLFRLQPRLTS
jgi:hypothetical protein